MDWFRLWIEWLPGALALVAIVWLAARSSVELKPLPALAIVLCLTGMALVLRLEVAHDVPRLWQEPVRLIGDESRYEWLATLLLQGQFFPEPGAMPLYPLFLAACYRLFGHTYGPVLLAQAVISTLSVPLTYGLARRFTGRSAACAAALIVAVHPNLVGQASRLYTEAVYTPLLLLGVLALVRALQAPRLSRFAWAGAAMGLVTLCRPTTALMPIVVAGLLPAKWTRRQRLLSWLAYALVMGAALAPWGVHNSRTHGRFVPLGVNLATLWQGSPEFYHLMRRQPDAMNWIWGTLLNPERNGGMNIVLVKGDREITARAIHSIQAEPGVYLWYSLQKLGYFWVGHPADLSEWPFDFPALLDRYKNPRLVVQTVGSRLLFLLVALAALFLLRRRWRELAVVLAVCGYFMVMHAILVPQARHSDPLYPLLAILIAAGFRESRDFNTASCAPAAGAA